MQLTIKRKTLKDTLDLAAWPIVQSRAPLCGSVLVRAKSNRLEIGSDVTSVRAFASIECAITKPGECLVEYDRLNSLVSRSVAEDIEISTSESSLNAKLGVATARLPLHDVATFPAERDPKSAICTVMPSAKDFGQAIIAASEMAGDGTPHPWNAGVFIKDDGSRMFICGGSNNQFVCSEIETTESKFECLIEAKHLRSIGVRVRDAGSFMVTPHERHIRFVIDDCVVDIALMAIGYGPVIGFAGRVKANCRQNVAVKRAALTNAMIIARGVTGPKTYGAALKMDDDSMCVSALSTHGEADFCEKIAAESKPTSPHECYVSNELVPRFLNTVGGDNVTIHWGDEQALRFTSDASPGLSWVCALMRRV